MSEQDPDHEAHADGHDHEAHAYSHDHEESFDRHEEHSDEGRVTSPMQEFGSSQVTTGFVVLVIGLVIVFGIPLLL